MHGRSLGHQRMLKILEEGQLTVTTAHLKTSLKSYASCTLAFLLLPAHCQFNHEGRCYEGLGRLVLWTVNASFKLEVFGYVNILRFPEFKLNFEGVHIAVLNVDRAGEIDVAPACSAGSTM